MSFPSLLIYSAKSRVSGSIKLKLLFYNNPPPGSAPLPSSATASLSPSGPNTGPPLPPRARQRTPSGNLRQQNLGEWKRRW